MLSHSYFESVTFSSGRNFNVSRHVDQSYLKKLHWHPFVEILVSLTDGNQVSVNFIEYPMNTNDLIIAYPGDLHSIDVCGDGTMLVIQFSAEMLTILNELNRSMALLAQYPYLKYDPGASQSDHLVMEIKKFCEAYETDSHFREVRMYSLLLSFFEEVGNRCMRIKAENSEEVANAKNKTIKKMAEACLYISQNCTQPLTLDDAAGSLGLNKEYFCRLFKKNMGVSYLQYVYQVRTTAFCRELETSDDPIGEIAERHGFRDPKMLTQYFREIYGCTPSEKRKFFREVNLEDPDAEEDLGSD